MGKVVPSTTINDLPDIPAGRSPGHPFIEAAQGDLEQPDGSTLVSIDVKLLDDHPDQYRLIYPIEQLDELAVQLKGGQTTPIRVRRKEGGRFELITGHRRARAAKIAGLTELTAVVVDVDDKRAAIEVILDNESVEGVGDFERATAYKGLIAKGMNQIEIAEALGVSKSLISMRLSFFDLPEPVLKALEKHPRAYSHNTVLKLIPLLRQAPELVEAAANGTVLVGQGDWSPQTLIAQICQQMVKAKTTPAKAVANTFAIADRDSRPILTMVRKPKGKVEIQLAADVDQDVFMGRLNALLRDEALKGETDLRVKDKDSGKR